MTPVTHATRLALTIAAFCALIAVGIIILFFLFRWQIGHSQTQWCDTLRVLTSHAVAKPADPVANPSRYQNWLIYRDLLNLKDSFGCR